MTKKIPYGLKALLVSVMSLLFLFVLLEVGFFIFFVSKEGKIVSVKTLFKEQFHFYEIGPPQGCSWGATVTHHPHLAQNYHNRSECVRFERNNFGFAGPNIDFEKNNDFYTVLILGGSVAEGLAVFKPEGKYLFESLLNKKWMAPNGKPFRVVSGALSAGRQPVQVMSTLLFSHIADAAISIEGYNEFTEYASRLLLETPPPIWMDLQIQNDHPLLAWSLKSIGTWIHGSVFPYLQFSYFHFFILSRSTSVLQSYWRSEFLKANPYPEAPEFWSLEQKKAYYLKRYQDYLANMHSIYKRQNIPSLTFFQPVPHFYKTLTSEEKSLAGSADVTLLYNEFVEHFTSVSQAEFPHDSLLKIYEKTSETVYIDTVHTNTLGLNILGDEIARKFAKRYGWRSKIQ